MSANAQERTVTIRSDTTHRDFGLGEVIATPDGGKIVTFVTGDGHIHRYPLNAQGAEQLGKALTSRVHVAGVEQLDELAERTRKRRAR